MEEMDKTAMDRWAEEMMIHPSWVNRSLGEVRGRKDGQTHVFILSQPHVRPVMWELKAPHWIRAQGSDTWEKMP